jgi:hypothetical protein
LPFPSSCTSSFHAITILENTRLEALLPAGRKVQGLIFFGYSECGVNLRTLPGFADCHLCFARIAKYNQLLRIEESLGSAAMYGGPLFPKNR